VGKVAILPPAVQGQIAAGEVIERPASVVRELVENALDAGARSVDVRLAAGGLELIAVRDDGEGMAADDAVLAFARHATSKLRVAEELARVETLGFRGEALPSIAAVASVRVVTRRAGDTAAAVVEADAAGARAAGVSGAALGTVVEARGLFAATPARRKFLRTPATEVGHVVDVLTRLAVAAPGIGFRLVHDEREVLAWPPVRELRSRLAQVLGQERAATLVPVEARVAGYRLEGFLGPPRETLATARLVWTYVAVGETQNARVAGRWVRDRMLLRAVLDGYASLLMRGRYPVAILFLHLPAGELDLNVHPAKLEVRFRAPTALHQLVVPALRARLRGALAVPGRVADAVGEGGLAYAASDGLATAVAPTTEEATPAPAGVPHLPLGPLATQQALWSAAPGGFRALRFLGQLFAGYLLCEGEDRVVLIDQHAAHERVVFERLCAEQAAGGVAHDRLLVPETIALPPLQVALLGEHAAALTAAGLEGEPFGEGTYLLRTVPRLLRGRDAGALIRAVAAELAEGETGAAAERARDAALATIACHAVVRVGQRLEPAEVRALLESMDGVPIAAHCPHGRPVAVELKRAQVEAMFRR
jgi:DNA mismatch repair protein MutL